MESKKETRVAHSCAAGSRLLIMVSEKRFQISAVRAELRWKVLMLATKQARRSSCGSGSNSEGSGTYH